MILLPRTTFPLLVLAALGSSPALAFFDFSYNSRAPAPAATNAAGTLTQLGGGTPTKVTGYGKDIPLPAAVEMLAPGWKLVDADGKAANIKVSWEPNGTWLDQVREISGKHQLRTLVNWNDRNIYVGAASDTTPDKLAALAEEHRRKALEATPQGRRWRALAERNPALAALPPADHRPYTFKPGLLSTNVGQILKQEMDLDLVWEAPPHIVKHEFTVYAKDCLGAIHEAFLAYRNAGVVLKADVKANGVVVVTRGGYQPKKVDSKQ